jgi:hypothetical protein
MSGVPFDVSDCILDPDFCQDIAVARRTESVSDKGRMAASNASFTCSAVVMPATPEQLDRVPEADRSNEVLAIYTTVLLTSGDNTHAPDVVTWKSGTYMVKSVQDWTDYGAGYCLALAVSNTMQGKAVT